MRSKGITFLFFTLAGGVLLAVYCANKSVLLRIPSFDHPGDYTIVVFNPLRSRAPENEAERILQKIKDGDCQEALKTLPEEGRNRICSEQSKIPIDSWKLENREDKSQEVVLFYSHKTREGFQSHLPLEIVLVLQGDAWILKDIGIPR